MEDQTAIFDVEAFQELPQPEQQARLQAEAQQFAQRRSVYQQLRNIAVSLEDYRSISNALTDFEPKFNEWYRPTVQLVKTGNVAECIKKFEEANALFAPMEELIAEIAPISAPVKTEVRAFAKKLTSDFERRATELISKHEELADSLRVELSGKIQSGIDDVLNIKRELELTDTFGSRIRSVVNDAPKKAKSSLIVFGVTLALLLSAMVGSFFVPSFKDLPWYASIGLRLSIGAPIFWFALVAFSEYKLHKLSEMKYDHLDRLLGGGASTIAQLVQSDEPAKAAVYRKLSELFLEIQDITQIVANRKNPTEASVKEANELLKEIRATADQVRKIAVDVSHADKA